MKKLSVILTAVLALVGCNKNEISQDGGAKIDLVVEVNPATKALSSEIAADDEKNINHLQVFVFSADGKLEISSDPTAESKVTLPCGMGPKTVVALVNANKQTAKTIEELYAATSNFSENTLKGSNNPASFVMVGQEQIEVTAETARAQVKVAVKRLASKIVIKSVERKFADAVDGARSLTITGMALKYVPQLTNFAHTLSPNLWYNSETNVELDRPTNVVGLTTEYNLNATLDNDAVYDVEHVFYTYPNDNASQFTILAVRTKVNGYAEPRYYPIKLPVIESNKVYTIKNLTITRIGGQYDNKDTIEFSVVVEDWENGEEWAEEY